MALTEDRNTPMNDGELVAVPVAAGATIYAGGIVVANATGYAAPGSTATGLTYLGRAEARIDNSAGADGDKAVPVRRGKAFKFKNSSGDAVTQAELGKAVYIEDDETVCKTGTGKSAAGVCIGVESDGIWVQ